MRHDGYLGLLTFWGDGGTGEDTSSGAPGLYLDAAASPAPAKSAASTANVKSTIASTSVIKPGARIRPQKWHRLCIVVDCKKQAIKSSVVAISLLFFFRFLMFFLMGPLQFMLKNMKN